MTGAVLGWHILSPQGGPAANRQGGLTTLVRFPDHTWEYIEEPLDSSVSQFQWLEITEYAFQGPLALSLPVLGLVKHRFPSMKTRVAGILQPACLEYRGRV